MAFGGDYTLGDGHLYSAAGLMGVATVSELTASSGLANFGKDVGDALLLVVIVKELQGPDSRRIHQVPAVGQTAEGAVCRGVSSERPPPGRGC